MTLLVATDSPYQWPAECPTDSLSTLRGNDEVSCAARVPQRCSPSPEFHLKEW